jgi:hypothetical protein
VLEFAPKHPQALATWWLLSWGKDTEISPNFLKLIVIALDSIHSVIHRQFLKLVSGLKMFQRNLFIAYEQFQDYVAKYGRRDYKNGKWQCWVWMGYKLNAFTVMTNILIGSQTQMLRILIHGCHPCWWWWHCGYSKWLSDATFS